MKKLIIVFISALFLTLFIEGYNYLRGDEIIDIARGVKIFVINFAAFYTVFFFIKNEKERSTQFGEVNTSHVSQRNSSHPKLQRSDHQQPGTKSHRPMQTRSSTHNFPAIRLPFPRTDSILTPPIHTTSLSNTPARRTSKRWTIP